MAVLTGDDHQIINKASNFLLTGHVVAIPTETVYGLAADIMQETAISNIYALKNRPIGHPLIVHIANEKQLCDYAIDIPNYAIHLIKAFWPGPLTLVLKKSAKISHLITGNQDTVAIRMPSHKITLGIIEKVGRGLAAPSANQFGRISPTCPQHVIDDLGSSIPIVDGGDCVIGIESTIVNASDPNYFTVLRPGHITIDQLKSALTSYPKILHQNKLNDVKVSGCLKSHYAPKKPLILFSSIDELSYYKNKFKNIYVVYHSKLNKPTINGCAISNDPVQFAKELYLILRRADQSTAYAILVEMPPKGIAWDAINDRLKKSSAK